MSSSVDWLGIINLVLLIVLVAALVLYPAGWLPKVGAPSAAGMSGFRQGSDIARFGERTDGYGDLRNPARYGDGFTNGGYEYPVFWGSSGGATLANYNAGTIATASVQNPNAWDPNAGLTATNGINPGSNNGYINPVPPSSMTARRMKGYALQGMINSINHGGLEAALAGA